MVHENGHFRGRDFRDAINRGASPQKSAGFLCTFFDRAQSPRK